MMNEREDKVFGMTNEEYCAYSKDYGRLIIEMVNKINDMWVLEQIYRCVNNITKES